MTSNHLYAKMGTERLIKKILKAKKERSMSKPATYIIWLYKVLTTEEI